MCMFGSRPKTWVVPSDRVERPWTEGRKPLAPLQPSFSREVGKSPSSSVPTLENQILAGHTNYLCKTDTVVVISCEESFDNPSENHRQFPAGKENTVHEFGNITTRTYSCPLADDTWIERLRDLGQYWVATEDDCIRACETGILVSRHWNSKASDQCPQTGWICHRLAVLARPDDMPQLFYYATSLCMPTRDQCPRCGRRGAMGPIRACPPCRPPGSQSAGRCAADAAGGHGPGGVLLRGPQKEAQALSLGTRASRPKDGRR